MTKKKGKKLIIEIDDIPRNALPPQNYPESASVEWVDQYGNHRMRYWYPVTYYQVTDRILGVPSSDVPLSDRAMGPREMPGMFKWLLGQMKSAREVISSTVPEIEVTKKRGKRKPAKRSKRKQ